MSDYDFSDFSFDRCIERLEAKLRDSEARNQTSLEVIRAREEHVEEQRVEIERLRAALDSARSAATGMSTFLTNEELAWACDTWPWLGEVEE